jgi:hypothetical protein
MEASMTSTTPTEPMTTPNEQPTAPITATVIQGTTPPVATADGTSRGPVGVVWPQQKQEQEEGE